MIEFKTFSANETVDLGNKLGRIIGKGDVICIVGGLGTGKTAFTSGIAIALGIDGYITSPTFTIVNEYSAPTPLFHFDVYRISDPKEMFEVGFDEYLNGDGVVVIEWAELIKDILPPNCIWVEISKDIKEGWDVRKIRIEFFGQKNREYERRLEEKQA